MCWKLVVLGAFSFQNLGLDSILHTYNLSAIQILLKCFFLFYFATKLCYSQNASFSSYGQLTKSMHLFKPIIEGSLNPQTTKPAIRI